MSKKSFVCKRILNADFGHVKKLEKQGKIQRVKMYQKDILSFVMANRFLIRGIIQKEMQYDTIKLITFKNVLCK